MTDILSGGGGPPVAGVIGWPIGHSLSPVVHATWLARHRLAGHYVPLAVQPDRLEAAVRGLAALGFRGVNVTVPHKTAMLDVVDAVAPEARRIGAVNTVVVGDDGTLTGGNTDVAGFWRHLCGSVAEAAALAARPALVLGAGGAARAVVAGLLGQGFADVRLANRTRPRADALVADLADARLTAIDWQDRDAALDDSGLLVNTTTLGMRGQPPLALDVARLPGHAVVYDIVYTPLETPLLAAARARSLATVDGLGMLLHQAVPAFEAFFGVRPEVDEALRQAVLERLGEPPS